MPPPIPADVIARIVELRCEGWTIQRIAEALNVSRGAVGNYTKAYVKHVPKTPKPPSRRKTKAIGRRFYDDPRFDHPPEDEYDDVIPIPFFPADLPRLIPDPFGWTPAELCSALAHAQTKEPIMFVEVSKLRLINIGQLIEVQANGTITMGKLERVKRNETGKVTLRISGDSVCVDETQQVNIRRSPELHESHLASLALEDLLEAGVGV